MRIKTYKIFTIAILLVICSFQVSGQEMTKSALKALGAPNNPKVQVAWNRFYDWEGITEILQKMVKAYPELATLESIGKSFEGRDLWCITITNTKTGKHSDKPAFYIDGAIHANEIQAVEICMYTAWYLLESYSSNTFIKELLDTKTFYIVPFESPDSRNAYLHHDMELRSGKVPRDDDGDGLVDEDGPEDINGDGFISMMRIKMKGGPYKESTEYKGAMVYCGPNEVGDYMVFEEGIDNDEDGELNEDGPGSYDPNRNWGWNWFPHYKQYGSDRYPFSIPEVKIVGDFLKSHSNIIGVQSYHNYSGLILRGPGNKEDKTYYQDDQVIDFIGKKGEDLLPGYKFITIWKDLYTTYGGETDFTYSVLGMLSYSNELWTPFNLFRKTRTPQPGDDFLTNYLAEQNDYNKFNKYLLFDEATIPWKEFNHPEYGKVEIGGTKSTLGRLPQSFLLEEECHRNMAFTLMNASFLPAVSIESVTKKNLPNGLIEITTAIRNSQPIPSRLAVDIQNRINRPDWITIKGAKVLAGGIKRNRFDEEYTEQKYNPDKLVVESVGGNQTVYAVWIVEGNSPVTIEYDSVKGGKASKANQ
jgi:hypothetical protein